jgi:acyl-CoA thioester hydrolase
MPKHQATYRILYRDIDSMGVLYYGRYLALFEMGRVEWLRSEGFRYRDLEQEQHVILPVTHASCDYMASLRYDDVALIQTWVESWTASTLRFGHKIESQESGVLCATGEVELACVRKQDHRPIRMPPLLRSLMENLVADRQLKSRRRRK